MKAFKNYGTSHLLATFIVTTFIALIPFGYDAMVGSYIDFTATAWALSGFCYLVMAVVGVPTEMWLRAKFAEPSLGRAYGVYALTGLAASLVAGGLLLALAISGGGPWQYALMMALVFYVLYLPIMLLSRGVFVPLERAFRKVMPLPAVSPSGTSPRASAHREETIEGNQELRH